MSDPAGPPPQPRLWDLVLTVGLLVVGAANVITSFAQVADLSRVVEEAFHALGVDGRMQQAGLAAAVGFGVNVVSVFALLWSAAIAFRRLREGRIGFWAPLTAGVVVTLVLAIATAALMVGDPMFERLVETVPTATPTP